MTRTRWPGSRIGAWLALWAMILHVAFPVLVQASGPAATEVVEICSAHGLSVTVAVDRDGNAIDGSAGVAQHECKCCVSGACGAVAAPARTVVDRLADAHGLAHSATDVDRHPDPMLQWRALRERAPPSLS